MISDDICKICHIKEITVSIAFKQKFVGIEKIAFEAVRYGTSYKILSRMTGKNTQIYVK